MWKGLLLCICGVMVCIGGGAAAPTKAHPKSSRVKRAAGAAAKTALKGFAKDAALDIGGKVVDKLGDHIAEKVVENHQEKVAGALEEYFSGQFDRADEEMADVIARGGSLLTGVGDNVKQARLTVLHSRGSNTGDTFAPPDQEIRVDFEHVDDSGGGDSDGEVAPQYYPMGVGSVIMSGCFGTNYSRNDPCFESKVPIENCANLIDGANFLGVGFDGRGEYSSDYRKKSILQRSCTDLQGYGDKHVPNTMTVLGIYDTDVETYSFSSKEEYRSYLEEKSAVTSAKAMFQGEMNKVQGSLTVSGIFGLIWSAGGGGGGAWGYDSQQSSFEHQSAAAAQLSQGSAQTFVAMLELNVFRYEIFLDSVSPDDLNLAFLRDFLGLPSTYFAIGADREFQNFILRWGTHYVTSAKFGGQIKIIKTKESSEQINQVDFARKSQADFKQLFSTYSSYQTQIKSSSFWHDQELKAEGSRESSTANQQTAESETYSGSESRVQMSYSNEVMLVQGGDQRIGAAITEFYTTQFGSELREWLDSIEEFPKAFEFTLQLITEVFDMNFDLLFPHGLLDYGCFGSRELSVDAKGRQYYVEDIDATNTTSERSEIRFCNFKAQEDLAESMVNRKLALERAIAVYLEEGPFVSADFSLPAGEPGCETSELALLQEDNVGAPSWQDMISGSEFTVIFDMPYDIPYFAGSKSSVRLKWVKHRWLVMRDGFYPHTYEGHRNGNSGDITMKKISVNGLVMTYDEDTGLFTVTPEDFAASSEAIPDLPDWINDMEVGRAEVKSLLQHLSDTDGLELAPIPCNLWWSNAHRIDPTDGGACIQFTAASEGDIFVVFAGIPRDHESWLTVEVSPEGVAMYRSQRLVTNQFARGARGLGTPSLYQSYFVCIDEDIDAGTTTVQYGKIPDGEKRHVVWMAHEFDQVLAVHYYAFGSGTHPVKIMRVTRAETPAEDFISCAAGLEKSGDRCVEINA